MLARSIITLLLLDFPFSSFLALARGLINECSVLFRFYTQRRSIRLTLSKTQLNEIQDVRLIIGIIALFYITNILTFYVSFCHIMKYHVAPLVDMLSRLSLVLNSTFKFPIYCLTSFRFRNSLKSFIAACSEKTTERETAENNSLNSYED